MKEFIVVIAALLLLIAFPIQSLFDAAFDTRQAEFDAIVHSFAEKARVEGCFTPGLINDMKAELSGSISGLSPGDITVTATTNKKYRGEDADGDSLIDFSVSMPMRNRFVGGLVFGNVVADNTMTYTCAGQVYSEAIP